MDPARRGTDGLDGALAGWLIVAAAGTTGRIGAPGGWLAALTALLLAGAVVPFLRFHPAGWWLAVAGLALHAVGSAARLDGGGGRALALLLPDLLALGYLAWVRPELVRRDRTAPAVAEPAPREPSAPAPAPPADPAPALAAIHRRIAEAGSACRVTAAEVRVEAERHGVDPALLATEGAALHRTFLRHFLAAGPLGPEQRRELECLARILGMEPEPAPAADPDPGISLAEGERCLAAVPVTLYRLPPQAAPGPEQPGLAPPRPLEGLARAGACRFVVTDRRLVLVAPSGQQSPLPLERVASTAAYANGIEVHPRRGPALFLHLADGAAEVASALRRARRATNPDPHSAQ